MPCLPNDFPGAVTTVPVLKNFMSLETEDVVAEEVPVALVYNGISHTVMMASPVMLEEFGTGFSLTEGIVESVSDIYDVEVIEACGSGREVRITISSEAFHNFKARRRAMLGRTGCGICGVESLGDALRPVPDLSRHADLRHEVLPRCRRAVEALRAHRRAHGLHPCLRLDQTRRHARGGAEDVGRHVALDKLLGLRAREGWRDGALVVSSRASYEMVQKAAMCGVEILFAVSAPTALAVRTAERCGMTLAAFARAGGPNVYTHPERLVGAQDERLCA